MIFGSSCWCLDLDGSCAFIWFSNKMFDCFIPVILADSNFKIFIAIDSAVDAKLDNSLVFVYGSLNLSDNTKYN